MGLFNFKPFKTFKTKDSDDNLRLVKKHPFIVKKEFYGYTNNHKKVYKWHVINEDTNDTWRTFDAMEQAYEFAYYSNGNLGTYSVELWGEKD